MNAIPAPRRPLAWWVNAGLLGGLLVLAGLLLAWHDPWSTWHVPAWPRWLWAAFGLLAWGLLCARMLWRGGRGADAASGGPAEWLVIHASQTGFAQSLALRAGEALRVAGRRVRVLALAEAGLDDLAQAGQALFVASTTGEGDGPDAAAGFVRRHMQDVASLAGLRYGMLALGDRSYAHFCGFACAMDHWLQTSGARPLFERIEVDNADPRSLDLWRQRLADLAGRALGAEAVHSPGRPWRLLSREQVNRGSPDHACFRLAFAAEHAADARWQAGDIAEVALRNTDAEVDAWLRRAGMDGAMRLPVPGGVSLREHASCCRLPVPESMAGMAAADLHAQLRPLPQREYSIASMPGEGRLELLIRERLHPDGRPGPGSAWLLRGLQPGMRAMLSLRGNPGFHPPADGRPLILIGNGTGMAGLRALLKSCVEAGRRRNWLIFGERRAGIDTPYAHDIEQWQKQGFLPGLDLVYSRAGSGPRYVQDRLRARVEPLREWLGQGAALYVCGSLNGMAADVDRTLRELLGTAGVDALAEAGRYRRDVY